MIAASLVRCDQEDSDSDNDSCIYTYRGDRQEPAIENLPMDDRSTSPLMDYLEMDFEPEPTVNNVSEDEEITEPVANNAKYIYIFFKVFAFNVTFLFNWLYIIPIKS